MPGTYNEPNEQVNLGRFWFIPVLPSSKSIFLIFPSQATSLLAGNTTLSCMMLLLSVSARCSVLPSQSFLFFLNLIYFIYFWLCWVFVAVHGLSLVAESRGYSSLRCTGFSLWWLLLLRSMGSRPVGFSSCGTWAQ